MPKIFSETKKVVDLTSSERAAMLGLLSIEFLGVRSEDFTRDLMEKDIVILLRKEACDGEIVGFSTLMVLDLPVDNRKIKGVFSGDTTVLEEYRSSTGLGVQIGRYFLNTLESYPEHDIFYILISKGWRTYKILPFFFRKFAPKHDLPTSLEDKSIMDAFGKIKYPGKYDPGSGLIVFAKETQRLVPGSIDAAPPSYPDEHTKFFLERNKTYLSGTELVCVAQIHESNFAPALVRLLKLAQKEAV